MFARYKKIPSTCSFTIHNLRLPEIIPDDFQIEWKRAENEGITERFISNDSVDIFFEKAFKCRVTMYLSKKDGSVKPKYINFQVNRYLQGVTKKVFGKLEVDISGFFNIAPVTKEFAIDSLHSKQSTLFMTFTVQPNTDADGKPIEFEGDLTSISEAMNIVSEHQSEWDFSEAPTEEERQRIQNFFEERESKKTHQSLAAFQSNPRFKRTHSKPLLADSQTDLFKSTLPPSPPGLRGLKNKGLRRVPPIPKGKEGGLSPGGPSSPIFLTPPSDIDLEKDKEKDNEKDKERDIVGEAKTMLAEILLKQWGESPVPTNEIPKASALLHAFLLSSQVYNDELVLPIAFEEFVHEFIKRLKLSIIVSRATEFDRFIVIFYLILLLQRERSPGKLRRDTIIKELLSLASFYISAITDNLLEPLLDLSRQLIAGAADYDSLAPRFVETVKQCSDKSTDDPFLQKFFKTRILEATDAQLVNLLSQSPFRCTFGNSIQFNSFITLLSDQGLELPKFREAVTVLQMGSTLCNEPETSKELCPKLPQTTIAKLLSNQQPDEFMPMPNDVMAFINAFNIDTTVSGEVPSDYTGNFSEIEQNFPTLDWKSLHFDKETKKQFPFLQNYFKE